MFELKPDHTHQPTLSFQREVLAGEPEPSTLPALALPTPAPTVQRGERRRCRECGREIKWTYCEPCMAKYQRDRAKIAKRFPEKYTGSF